MLNSDTHHEQEGKASLDSPLHQKPQGPLDAMRRQLEEHSALEDLGPLFGPQAQGQVPEQGCPGRDPR
ncbi:hypothetical protein VB734_08295 [Synechococcus sp. BA-124 BA4]|uniref:hypothetical protein n=1 Tax=unclassified Synechococcus TaxID=2626047 RepID=UPI002AD290EF|nr:MULTISPECIES: hypothetical protein [unclassified Synechococcus]MEA5400036.1 hypothetical protein [Synechococcus sp. BA-124 BA4]CAK6701063.1 hypothetical protein BBFGKLBO_03009 [Synechococcus sp. CBW1107]